MTLIALGTVKSYAQNIEFIVRHGYMLGFIRTI